MFKYLLENGKNETTKLKKGNIKIKISMFNYILNDVLMNTLNTNKKKSPNRLKQNFLISYSLLKK